MEPLKGPGQLKAMQFVQKWLVPHKYFYLELHNFKFKNSELCLEMFYAALNCR